MVKQLPRIGLTTLFHERPGNAGNWFVRPDKYDEAVVDAGGLCRLDRLQKFFLPCIQIDHRRAVSSTPEACDFYCINTAFVSHKLVRNVQSRYPSLVNRMFYYNGTNVENLIKSAYSFVKQWSNESNRDR